MNEKSICIIKTKISHVAKNNTLKKVLWTSSCGSSNPLMTLFCYSVQFTHVSVFSYM